MQYVTAAEAEKMMIKLRVGDSKFFNIIDNSGQISGNLNIIIGCMRNIPIVSPEKPLIIAGDFLFILKKRRKKKIDDITTDNRA